MSVTFQWEHLRKVLAEPNARDLMLEHWRELGVHKEQMPLDPHFEWMCEAADQNIFMTWTARDGKTLVGYIAFWVKPHPHYKSTLTAMEDLYLLTASHRKGLTGYRMLATAFEALKARGVQRIMLHSKVHFEKDRGGLDRLFERLGCQNTDKLWSKML